VQVKHVARVRFTARRAAQQQRELAIGDGLLGEIRAWRLVSRKYSAMVTPVYGARNWRGAASEALAATTVVYSIAPNLVSLSTT
jgi:flagellar biosynthesis component FlhA